MNTIFGPFKLQRFARLGAFLICAVCAISSSSAKAQGFTVEQIMSSPFPEGLTTAAHVARVAWLFDARGVRNVWVADAPSFAARQVTHYSDDDGMALASLRLTPDGRTVVYARGSELNSVGEVADPTSNVTRPNQQVWAVDVDKGEPRQLGELNCTREGCEDIELSPDGTLAVWAARGQLWAAPVSGAVPGHQLAFVRGENDSPQWSPDGTENWWALFRISPKTNLSISSEIAWSSPPSRTAGTICIRFPPLVAPPRFSLRANSKWRT